MVLVKVLTSPLFFFVCVCLQEFAMLFGDVLEIDR